MSPPRLHRMLINGQLVTSDVLFDVVNPATGLRFASAPSASAAQVTLAIKAASAAFKPWSLTPVCHRAQLLLQAASVLEANRTDLEILLVKEQGKPLPSAVAEMNSAIASFRSAAEVQIPIKTVKETATHILQVQRKPLGVVVGITPWNFPLSLGCGKIGRALAHGNTIILKPSPFTPLTSLLVGELLKDVFPPGVVNVVTGPDGREGNVGQQLVESEHVSLVSFTGSGPTGKKIMAACAANMTRVMLELGGNDPALVLPDADLDHAVKGIFAMTMANSGQICCAIKRVYVHVSQFEEFVQKATQMALSSTVGDGFTEGTHYGPLNNAAQLDRVKLLVEDARKNGAIVASKKMETSDGFFFAPTILTNVSDGMRIVDEEQFGPVMPVMKYSQVDEAIVRANHCVYGLGASVWGRDAAVLNQVANQLEAGYVWTNQHAVLREGAPFGGMKQSGFRREGDGAEADLETYTEIKSIKLAK